MSNCVLLDTSFFIRLYNPNDELHDNAKAYLKYFLEHGIELKISTIAIAEFCVKGAITDLPLRNLQVLPFNFDHAIRAGEFMRTVYEQRAINATDVKPRAVIPNDTKMFAQADLDENIDGFVSADGQAIKVFDLLKERLNPKFTFINISVPCNEYFSLLF